MRLVFMGSGAFAVPSLEALLAAGYDVCALVAQPDRESGRGRALAAPPTKPVALARGVPVLQPRRIKAPDALAALRALEPELLVVVAYGQILSRAVLDVAPRGAVNVHGSLLPRWRGAAPIQWSIVQGDDHTGVTTMLLDEGLDTGPLLLSRATPIGAEENAAELHDRLASLGADLLLETLSGLAAGTLVPSPQDETRATHARIIDKQDGQLDWHLPAQALACRVRGFHPWPGTFTSLDGARLKVLRAQALDAAPETEAAAPGTLLALDDAGLVIACGAGSRLRVLSVQPESRRAMSAAAFAAGARLRSGALFA
jgi:methionyl-tRNA formyltransferase